MIRTVAAFNFLTKSHNLTCVKVKIFYFTQEKKFLGIVKKWKKYFFLQEANLSYKTVGPTTLIKVFHDISFWCTFAVELAINIVCGFTTN